MKTGLIKFSLKNTEASLWRFEKPAKKLSINESASRTYKLTETKKFHPTPPVNKLRFNNVSLQD